MRPLVPPPDAAAAPDSDGSARRSIELDRRKALLLGQHSAQGTPTQSRRRVFRGGHTRTLSLLSPTKATDDFNVHEDMGDDVTSPSKELEAHFQHAFSQYGPVNPSQLSKRASWAPRSAHQLSGFKQVVHELRAGLSTFVEDLRQATVGDEAVTGEGQPLRSIEGGSRENQSPRAGDQETIRAPPSSARPRIANAFEETPTPPPRFTDPLGLGTAASGAGGNRRKPSRSEARASKSFSWTPLVVDSYEDQDWSSWDSPTAMAKTDRWSGSTVIGDGSSGPEKVDSGTPL